MIVHKLLSSKFRSIQKGFVDIFYTGEYSMNGNLFMGVCGFVLF